MTVTIMMLYFGFNFLKGIDFFVKTHKYYAVYNNVLGLSISNPVFVNGYAVGRVSNISIMQERNNKILVEMDISASVKLGDSTVAVLKSDLFGSKSIELTLGNITNIRNPGDTITAELDRGIAEIFAESAQPVANNLESTIKKINAILDNLTGNSDKINQIMTDLSETPPLVNKTLVKTNIAIDALTASMTSTSDRINTTLSSTDPIIRNLKVTTDSLRQLELRKTLLLVQEAIENLNVTLASFQKTEGSTLGKLMNEDSLYVNLNATLEDLNGLINHMNSNPKHFFAPLGKSSKKIERNLRKEEERNRNN